MATQALGDAADVEAALGRAVMRLLRSAQESAPAAPDPGTLLDLMSEEGARMLPDGEAVICMIDGDEMAVAGASGPLAAALAGVRGPLAGTIVARCIAGGTAVDIADPAGDPLIGPVVAGAGLTVARAVPLPVQNDGRQPLGVYVALGRQQTRFTEAEQRSMDVYAVLIGLSQLRLQQQRQVAAYSQRLAVGVDLSVHLAASLESGDVVQGLPQRAAEAVDADRATLFRLEGEDAVAEATFDVDRTLDWEPFRIRVDSQPLLREAADKQGAVQGRLSIGSYPEGPRKALASVLHSLVLPLVFGGQVLGFLNIHRRREPAFDDDAIAMAHIIGNVAAVALRNARLYADAQSARESMSEFLDVVVHELRAPLTIVGGYLSMISEGIFGEPPAAWQRPLDMIDSKLTEAQRLVDELLLAARVASGAVHSEVETVDLVAQAHAAAARSQARAELLEAVIDVDTTEEPVLATGDTNHVRRILDNLINNALSYGGQPARITVTAASNGTPFVSVADRGAGIPHGQRAHIFERFYKGPESTTGFGLGLYVSRQLAESSLGSLELDTEYAGPGSRFVLRLPFAADAAQR